MPGRYLGSPLNSARPNDKLSQPINGFNFSGHLPPCLSQLTDRLRDLADQLPDEEHRSQIAFARAVPFDASWCLLEPQTCIDE